MKKVALFIIVVGLALTIFTAFTFFTREKVAKIGDVQITRDKPHNLNWSPLFGIAVIGAGGILYLVSAKK
jgi:hypothetical protein